jgi:DNA helicase TIP49 (TBP-interacting protein)
MVANQNIFLTEFGPYGIAYDKKDRMFVIKHGPNAATKVENILQD